MKGSNTYSVWFISMLRYCKQQLFRRALHSIHCFSNRYLLPAKRKRLPDFLIIGAQKSGTSALARNLQKHPSIYIARNSSKKGSKLEMQFFNQQKNWQRGVQWYLSHFTRPDLMQGEKTPGYLFESHSHKRMAQIVPHAKLLIILRNPVDRAYSQWNHYNQIITESKQFGWVESDFKTALQRDKNILLRGQYIDQIEHLQNYFNPKQIHFIIAERIKKNPTKEIAKVYSFLGIPSVPINLENYHERTYATTMHKEIREQLYSHYRPYNQRLFNHIGYSVSEWSE